MLRVKEELIFNEMNKCEKKMDIALTFDIPPNSLSIIIKYGCSQDNFKVDMRNGRINIFDCIFNN